MSETIYKLDFGTNYKPDILSCLADLSNDEVFTPPEIANAVLDLLPKEIWSDPNIKILDPACKTGIFLREAAKRFIEGEKEAYPDLQERINHIFYEQLYGIAITELTSLISRRSIYCSKYPNGPFSISKFDHADGNIRYKNTSHVWSNGRCAFCGAAQSQFGDSVREGRETHAYELIHSLKPEEIFEMKFDVIISNPPYQLSDGGGMGSSATPIYNMFVDQAMKLNPRYLTMIIPSRWFSGGRGLDDFREHMLHDNRIRVIHDFRDASDIFPGVTLKGGVCYFLWDRDNRGDCEIHTNSLTKHDEISVRPLLEDGLSVFLRDVEQITILNKVKSAAKPSFSDIVSANDPFGFDIRVTGSYKRIKPDYKLKPFKNSVSFYYNGWRKEGVGYIGKDKVLKNRELIGKYKIFIPKAWGKGDHYTDWLSAFIVEPDSASTETYLTVGPFEDKKTAENALSYINTKFFHFMVSMKKITQNSMKNVYEFVPLVDLNQQWNDQLLYKEFNLSQQEIDMIEEYIVRKVNED